LVQDILNQEGYQAMAMLRMIDSARYFEHQVKLMKLASENDAASARLMRMSS